MHLSKDFPSCADLQIQLDAGQDAGTIFEIEMPKELIDPATVDAQDIDAGDMGRLTRFMACAAAATDYGAYVADSGRALFTSAKHKRAAYAALDQAARGAGAEAEAARRFAEQMRAYEDNPTG